MLAIVLTFDSLPCAALGCYGNEWIDTPHFDRLAAEGFVFDAHVATDVNDAGDPFGSPEAWTGFARQVERWRLFREADACSRWPSWVSARATAIEGSRSADASPRTWPFARLMQAARTACAECAGIGETGNGERREVLWLHSAGVPLPCLVSPDVEALYIDEFSDRGIDWSRLSPEERACHPAVQAAYVSCLDHFLGELLATIGPMAEARPVLLIVSAVAGGCWRTIPRHFALPAEMESQRLRGPSIWWMGAGTAGRTILPGRSPALVQPIDVLPTLSEWLGLSTLPNGNGLSLWPLLDGTQPRIREVVVLSGGVVWTERDVTVLTRPDSGDPAAVRYFLWPEDLWQANDLCSQFAETAAERVRTYSESVSRERPRAAPSSG